MNLYIRLQNGQPIEHPIFETNLKEAFPNVDLNNLPPEFARFTRIQRPKPSLYQVVDPQPTYQFIDGVVQDVWNVRAMTDEEKQAKQQILIEGIELDRKNYIALATKKLETCPDAQKPYWEKWIQDLTNFTYTLESANVLFPNQPRFDSNNNLLSLNASGSKPLVIG